MQVYVQSLTVTPSMTNGPRNGWEHTLFAYCRSYLGVDELLLDSSRQLLLFRIIFYLPALTNDP